MRAPRPRARRDLPLTRARRSDGEATEKKVYAVALTLFRRRGFAETTMRDVARGAGLSLGAAYHYFPSKDAILQAYFAEQIGAHERLFATRAREVTDLRERLAIAFDTGLEVRRKDRALLGALAKVVLDRASGASLFGEASSDVRRRSIAIFARAIEVSELDTEVKPLLATALWALHLGLLLYFVSDRSRGAAKTTKLTAEVLDLVPPIALLFGLPAMSATRDKLVRALADAGVRLAG
jgi:AcrR family transcriptional regulator